MTAWTFEATADRTAVQICCMHMRHSSVERRSGEMYPSGSEDPEDRRREEEAK